MKTFEEAKAIMQQYVNQEDVSLRSICSSCCLAAGGGKSRYQDQPTKIKTNK